MNAPLRFRHGDVLLSRLDEAATDEPATDDREIVVAEGEVTGHAHRVRGKGAVLRDLSSAQREGVLRLNLPQGGTITHEEHGPITLPPGVYEIRHQQTLTQRGVWERVRD